MNLDLVTYRVTGLTPLLQNNPEKMVRPTGGISRKTIPTAEEEAEAGACRLPSGQLYVSTISFRSALLGAAAGKRIGKTSAKTILSGSVFTAHETAGLVHPSTDEPIKRYEVSVMRAVVQRQGIMRARPRIDKWACEVTFEIDADYIVDLEVLTQLLNEAGHLKGVGDFRPQRSGSYGRFEAELQA